MFISFREILDIVAMTAIVGFIFVGFISRFRQKPVVGFDWKAFWIAALVTAPAIILHELSHKFVAIGLGFSATFYAAYVFLAIGVILALFKSNFIFFVPAYVVIGNGAAIPSATYSIIAVAGPAMNLFLWLGSWFAFSKLRNKYAGTRHLPPKSARLWLLVLYLTKQINMLLFIFNMLPIPGFDGFKFYSGLWQVIF
jgi:Zn-dependent protease